MATMTTGSDQHMMRDVDWKQVVFIAAGVPALVLFSMGGISATVGSPAWLVWTISVLFGFAQSFIYAEIAGPASIEDRRHRRAWRDGLDPLQPHPGAAVALVELARLDAGAGHRRGLGAGYLLSIFFAPDSPSCPGSARCSISASSRTGLSLRINATFLHRRGDHAGGLRHPASRHPAHGADLDPADRRLAAAALRRLHHPAAAGQCAGGEFPPFTPLATNNGQVVPGVWDKGGWLPLPRRPVHRRLVRLRLRDLRLLHERVQESRPRHAAGDHCLGPHLHRRLCRHPGGLPGRAGNAEDAGSRHL